MEKTLIIRGYPGVGKTYVGQKYDDIIDLESSDYKWIYDSKVQNMNKELRKSTNYKKLNPAWPNNYIETIKSLQSSGKYKVILVAPDEEIKEELDRNNIEYSICIPDISCKEEYYQRFVNRGNTQEFIDVRINKFEQRIKQLMSQPHPIIILNPKEYLEDYLIKVGIIKPTLSKKK